MQKIMCDSFISWAYTSWGRDLHAIHIHMVRNRWEFIGQSLGHIQMKMEEKCVARERVFQRILAFDLTFIHFFLFSFSVFVFSHF